MKVVLFAIIFAVMITSTAALFTDDVEADCEKEHVQKGSMLVGGEITKEHLAELRMKNLLARMRTERGRRIQLAQNWFSKNDRIHQGEK